MSRVEEPSAPSVLDELIAMEFQEALLGVEERMPADLRDIYTLWSTGDWSHEQLAKKFEVPVGTINARCMRIRRFLEREMARIKDDTHVQGVI